MSYTTSCYGFENLVIAGLPSSVEQFDTMAGRQGAALEAAVDYYVAHPHLTRVRRVLVEKLEAATGVARKRDGKKVSESAGAYMKRLEAELGEDLWENYRSVAEESFAETPVVLTRIARASTGGTIAKKYLEIADEIAKEGKVEAFCAKHGIAYSDEMFDGDELTEDAQMEIARKVKSLLIDKEREERAKLKAARDAAKQSVLSL